MIRWTINMSKSPVKASLPLNTGRVQILYCIFFIVLAGCASFGDSLESSFEKRMHIFEQTTFKYENALRWGYFSVAYDYIKKTDSGQVEPDFGKLRDIRISTYEVLKSTLSGNEQQALRTVEIKYYNINTLIEKTLIIEEKWEFDREEKRWYLLSNFPDFK